MILLPCPFCGSDPIINATRQTAICVRHFVQCTNLKCGCSLLLSNTPNQAGRLWNRRIIALRAVSVPSVSSC